MCISVDDGDTVSDTRWLQVNCCGLAIFFIIATYLSDLQSIGSESISVTGYDNYSGYDKEMEHPLGGILQLTV